MIEFLDNPVIDRFVQREPPDGLQMRRSLFGAFLRNIRRQKAHEAVIRGFDAGIGVKADRRVKNAPSIKVAEGR